MRRATWVWIRVPLEAIVRAVELLKQAAMTEHQRARHIREAEAAKLMRGVADQDDRHAENLKEALRDDEEPPAGRK